MIRFSATCNSAALVKGPGVILRSLSLSAVVLSVVAMASSGCANVNDGGKTKAGAPMDLVYASNPANYTYGVEITPNVPSTEKGALGFTVTPALPSGLSLDPITGTISGTAPSITPVAVYTVKATNSYGTGFTKLTLAVNDVVPTITYAGTTTLTYTVGTTISTITPTLGGGPTVACQSVPSLPAGLSLSTACVLTGTPTVAAPTTTVYQITAINSGGSAALPLTLTVNDISPAFTYPAAPFLFVRGTAGTGIPTNTGGVIASCASAPTLPAGLSLSSGCVISGTPTTVTASASYTITGTNSGGSAARIITVDVHDLAPSITYSPNTRTLTKGTSVGTISASNLGGLPNTCTSSPTLPAGLAISSTCEITGTPTALSATTAYTITATNSAAPPSATTLTLAVNDVAPTLNYIGSPFTYTHGTAITPPTVVKGGGTVVSCTSSPTLPAGLSISSGCVISGTPTIGTATATYTITATNTGGTASKSIVITVRSIAPSLTYSGSPFNFSRTVSISNITPTNSGDAPTSCSSAPALPAGLSLSATCVISGTPTVTTATAPYVITATNSIGSDSETISITVNDAPPVISYVGNPFSYTRNSAITALTPANSGGTVVSCASVPALPNGLSLSATCVLTGTPTAITAAANYVITATNSGGTGSATINITVNDIVPAITFAGSPFTYNKNSAITTLTPTNTGGTVVSCSASPTLPTGLSLSATCVLSGTPTSVSPATGYTITGTNTGGSSSYVISITVNDLLPVISYVGSPFTYVKNSAITALTVTNSGGAIVSCVSAPTLPVGLSITSGCTISGTPTTVVASASYTITATNSAGSASTAITIQVNDIAPSIAYVGSPFNYTVGSAITTLTPTNTGGTVISCASVPTLPSGLTLSATCGISGTPTAPAAVTSYTITATNSGGTSAPSISITVVDVAPTIAFSGSPFTFYRTTAISAATPSNSGGTIVSCASVPTLPTGLALSSTCVISGTPTVLTAAASYTITATNSGGNSPVSVNIQVLEPVPVIAFTGSPYTFTKDVAISAKTPTSSGGAIVSCAPSPALPAGLSLSSACVISGTPTAITASASYTITATNTGGTGTDTVTILVNDGAPSINYIPTTYNFSYTKGTVIAALTPNNVGGPITSCTISPALPGGLTIAASDCSITGTPTVVRSALNYTVTATNTGGSASDVITITINDAAPVIAYAGSPFAFTKNVAISAQTPTNTGGTILSCTTNPGLPNGLSLSSACVITGTATALNAAASYTITATNTGGSSSATVSIAVNDVAPTLSYTGSPFAYTVGVAITTLTPTTGGGPIISCASSPALPDGLAISSGCVITGTPTTVAANASYTITATNSGGNGPTAINIAVANGPPILSFSGSPFTFTRTVAITTLTPINTGGVITSCASVPTLPAGLSLSGTCVISGTPSVNAVATAYAITGTNGVGNSVANINITVKDVTPSISFTPGSVAFVLRTPVSSTSPANTGGPPTSCTSSPALPTGLSISSACVITGTPTVLSASTSFSITATNTGGSSSSSLSIQVKNQPVVLFYSLTALAGTDNGSAPLSQNIWKATLDGIDRTSLTQNSNANLHSILPSWISGGSLAVYSSRRAQNGATNGTATSSYNIWNSTTSGSSPTPLSANTAVNLNSDEAPQYSPDGSKVVFASKMAVNGAANGTPALSYNIFIMDADGTNKVALTANTNSGLDSYTPTFSPDGTQIYFSSKTASNGTNNGTVPNNFNIWRINVDGTNKIMLTTETTLGRDSIEPAVSPDGTAVVYASKARIVTTTANSYNIWRMNFNGTSKTSLTSNTSINLDSRTPKYSPDGTEITFISRMAVNAATANSYNVWKVDETGLNAVALTYNNAAGLDCEMPNYSPDNLRITFASLMDVGGTPSSSYNIFVIKSDGTGSETALTSNTNAGLDSFLAPFNVWYAE